MYQTFREKLYQIRNISFKDVIINLIVFLCLFHYLLIVSSLLINNITCEGTLTQSRLCNKSSMVLDNLIQYKKPLLPEKVSLESKKEIDKTMFITQFNDHLDSFNDYLDSFIIHLKSNTHSSPNTSKKV